MREYMLLMHGDTQAPVDHGAWALYFAKLRSSGRFDGGSSIGGGEAFRKAGAAGPVALHIGGYIRLRAENSADAAQWIAANPVYLAGGTVELRELIRD